MNIGVFGSDGKSSIIKILKSILFDITLDIDELKEECQKEYDYLIFSNYTFQYNLDVIHFLNNLKGTLIYNCDDYYSNLFKVNSSVSYGLENGDIKAINIKYYKTHTVFDLVIKNNIYQNFETNLIGEFNIYNILACIPICLMYINIKALKDRIKLMPKIEGLVEYKFYNDILYIKDFSHTPNSVFEVLSSTLKLTSNNLIVISECKSNIINSIISYFCDFLILTNDSTSLIKKENYITSCNDNAVDIALKIANYNDIVLHFKN